MTQDITPAKAAEQLSVTELERQERDALLNMLRAKAAKDRAEQAAFIAAALASQEGAIFRPVELAAMSSAALRIALKGYRMHVDPDTYSELRSTVLAAALRIATGERRIGRPTPADRARLAPAERLFHAPYGSPAADRRERLYLAAAIRAERGGCLPRANVGGPGDVLNVSYLATVARRALADLAERNTRTDSLTDELAAPASHPLAALAAADLAAAIGATDRERLALDIAIDGESAADIAALTGRTREGVNTQASKGRVSLRKRWTNRAALAADLYRIAQEDTPLAADLLTCLPATLARTSGPLHGSYSAGNRIAPLGERTRHLLAYIGTVLDRVTDTPAADLESAASLLADRAALARNVGSANLRGKAAACDPDRADAAASLAPFLRWPMIRAALCHRAYGAKAAREARRPLLKATGLTVCTEGKRGMDAADRAALTTALRDRAATWRAAADLAGDSLMRPSLATCHRMTWLYLRAASDARIGRLTRADAPSLMPPR